MVHRTRVEWSLCGTIWLFIAPAVVATAQGEPTPAAPSATATVPPSAEPPAPAPADKRAENAELLRVAQRRLEAGDPTDSAAAQIVALYQSLDAVLAQQEAVALQIKDLEKRRQELDSLLQAGAAADEKSSCTFLELDEIKDELAAEQARGSLIDDRLAAAKSALEKAEAALAEAQTKRRQAQEALENGKNAENAATLAAAAEQAVQTAKLAAETVALRRREIDRETIAQAVQRLAVRRCEQRVARFAPTAVFTSAEYEQQIDAIRKKEESAGKSLLRARAALHGAEIQLQQAQQELDAEQADRTVAAEKLEAARWARVKLADEIDSLTQRVQYLARLRVAWNRRYAIASSDRARPSQQAYDELKSWQKDTRGTLDELAADLRMQILRMRDLRSSLTSITKKLEAATKEGPPALAATLDAQRRAVEDAIRIHETSLITIDTSRRVHEKLLDEVGRNVQILNPKNLALGVWHQAEQIWNFEVTHIDGKSIGVGKIVTCLLIFSGGWICARISSALFANRILRGLRLSKDATAAVRTLVFYSLLAIVTLAALKTVNVPLTAFTILGGALAIGVGFGSQALINNFIGGLIMLAERPVRLGERIKFSDYEGVVEDVGFRCTRLRTLNDHLVTIPNSTLVNESIENVARRRTIRRLINVTITYDTPRDKITQAIQAIREVLEEKGIRERIHPIVGFEEFPPRVYFNDFNPDSLNILVVYWYAPAEWWPYVEHCERVNMRILEEFARLRVEFAFPSRTVYVVNQSQSKNSADSARRANQSFPDDADSFAA